MTLSRRIKVKVKVKVHTLDIAPLRSESQPQKRSGMTRVLKGFHSLDAAKVKAQSVCFYWLASRRAYASKIEHQPRLINIGNEYERGTCLAQTSNIDNAKNSILFTVKLTFMRKNVKHKNV